MSQTVTPYLEMSQAIVEAGGEALKKCYQCGTNQNLDAMNDLV